MTTITLHEGDNRITLRRLIDAGVRVHSVVCDPPYGLTSITKRFGKKGAAPAKFGSDGAFQRAGAGFMGSKWDGTGIERDPEFWQLIHDILLPGGYVIAFSGSRTGHWQACAMEMAGFVMHPMLGWLYGQGFPKAHNAAMAIDKQLGAAGPRSKGFNAAGLGAGYESNGGSVFRNDHPEYVAPKVKTPEAQQWEGWAYGGQALKPALEPIYVGQRPFAEKNGALNLLRHGVGAINIDGCRVATTGESRSRDGESALGEEYREAGVTNFGSAAGSHRGEAPAGRHPANLLHDGSTEVVALFPQSGGQQGDVKGTEPSRTGDDNTVCYGQFAERLPSAKRNDTGSAARFFNSFPDDVEFEEIEASWTSETGLCQARLLVDTAQSPPKVIAASDWAESSEWNTFLFGSTTADPFLTASKSIIEMKTNSTTESKIWNFWTHSLTKESTADACLSTESGGNPVGNAEQRNTLTITMSEKTEFLLGASPVASQTRLNLSVVVDRFADPIRYHGKAGKGDRAGSLHPTVKPVALMRWLVRLVTPPGGLVLDPFAGSGTTAAAARAEGFDCMLMEAEAKFATDIRARFKLAAPIALSSDLDALLTGAAVDDVDDLLG